MRIPSRLPWGGTSSASVGFEACKTSYHTETEFGSAARKVLLGEILAEGVDGISTKGTHGDGNRDREGGHGRPTDAEYESRAKFGCTRRIFVLEFRSRAPRKPRDDQDIKFHPVGMTYSSELCDDKILRPRFQQALKQRNVGGADATLTCSPEEAPPNQPESVRGEHSLCSQLW